MLTALSSLSASLQTASPTATATAAATTLFVLYLAYVRSVRYKRRKEIEQMPDPLVAGFRDAHRIQKLVTQYEFPLMGQKSLEFGLFRTYGIPTIAKLLSTTKELTHNVNRRYDDTELLIREMYEHDVDDDERAMLAVRRMNFLHSQYNISQPDYLYTLSVFVCEPLRWIERYEWRELTEKERNASYVYWREIGIRMGIKNIPPNVDALFKFNEEYEAKYMKYHVANRKVADATVELFLSVVPPLPGLRAAANAVVRSLMDDRLCATFDMQPAPVWLQKFVRVLLYVRAFVIRHMCLPRSKAHRRTPEKPMAGKSPTRYCPIFNIYGNTYPDGYRIETLGPEKFEHIETLGVVHDLQPDSIASE